MNTINYISIIEAINELSRIGKTEIAFKLQNILKSNEISKPELHNSKEDKTTSHYKVDLSENDLEEIRNVFSDLEVGSLTDEGEAGNSTARYVSLLNNWLSVSGWDENSASL